MFLLENLQCKGLTVASNQVHIARPSLTEEVRDDIQADALTVKQPHARTLPQNPKHNHMFSVPRFRNRVTNRHVARTSMYGRRAMWVLHQKHEHTEELGSLHETQTIQLGLVAFRSTLTVRSGLVRPNGGWLNRQRSRVRTVCIASPFGSIPFRSGCAKQPLRRHQ